MQNPEEEIVEKFSPEHLKEAIPEKTEDLKAEIEGTADKEAEKAEDPEKEAKAQKEYSFDFNWKDFNGKVWKGKFTNQILDIRNQQFVGIARARMAQGLPLESLDDLTTEINLMIAHMTFSLTEKPEWAADLRTLTDVRLIQEIYTEVLSHENMFHGYVTD